MTIRFVLFVNKQGQTRLAQYYEHLSLDERRALEGEIVRKCLARTDQQVRPFLSPPPPPPPHPGPAFFPTSLPLLRPPPPIRSDQSSPSFPDPRTCRSCVGSSWIWIGIRGIF